MDRSDSKNPATTCKGVTSSGRPCRRGLASTPSQGGNGVLAVSRIQNHDEGAAAFFCYQHKDQAEDLVRKQKENEKLSRVDEETTIMPLQGRNSLDDLAQRLGVLGVDEKPSKGRRKRKDNQTPNKPIERPPTWGNVQGPLLSIPGDLMGGHKPGSQSQPSGKRGLFNMLLKCCCGNADDEDYMEVIKHKRRHDGQQNNYNASPVRPSRPTPSPGQTLGTSSTPNLLSPTSPRPSAQHSHSTPGRPSETGDMLSYIPPNLSPQLTSTLLNELAKPLPKNEEPGYIYIFWLTDEDEPAPPKRAASSLLEASGTSSRSLGQTHGLGTSNDVLHNYKNSVKRKDKKNPEKNTIFLKIGRANNVHRRMNEWTRQCGYEVNLVRFYPYVSPHTPTPSPGPGGARGGKNRPSLSNEQRENSENGIAGERKMPHAHRVERLIHLELGEQRIKKDCEACGKEHREWFEVEATREGVGAIDECIRRWVKWSEDHADM